MTAVFRRPRNPHCLDRLPEGGYSSTVSPVGPPHKTSPYRHRHRPRRLENLGFAKPLLAFDHKRQASLAELLECVHRYQDSHGYQRRALLLAGFASIEAMVFPACRLEALGEERETVY